MRQRSLIIAAVAGLVLVVGAVAAYAYDHARRNTITKGVTVAGVDVGGLSRAGARRKLAAEVGRPLMRPVVVRFRNARFTLSAHDAGARADVDGMVDAALARSRSGFILSRVARDLTGGSENAALPAKLSYSQGAVARMVARVQKGIDQPARDATLDFPSLARVKEQNGQEVQPGALTRDLRAALVSRFRRRVDAPVQVTRPKVTRRQLAQRYPVLIVVERGAFQLKLYRQLRLVHSYTIAVGQVGLETPAGLYHIQNKEVNPSWHVPNSAWAGSLAGRTIPPGPADPIKARWLGIFAGAGIHGTEELGSLGTAASHGCIRMAIPDVIALYPQVPVGTPIYIA